MRASTRKTKRWVIAIPVALGIAALVALLQSRRAPEQVPVQEPSRSVRVISVPSVDLVPKVVGYGTVAPGTVWEAVAQVSGKIIAIHPKLDAGQFLPEGATLLRIDPADFELEIAQIEADIAATRAQLVELDVREENTRTALAIERESLAIGQKELDRKRGLVQRGTVTRSEAEREERTVLAQRQSVTSQENLLRLLPVERQLLEAQLTRYQARLELARLSLERTVVELPFAARIAQLNVENNQYVRVGDALVVADDISVAEVVVQIPIQRFRNIIETRDEPIDQIPGGDLGKFLGVSGRIRLPELGIEWPARLVRISPTLDPDTRTIGAILEVDEPYRQARLGTRPPLVKEMFVEVLLWGRPRANARVIPRTALHGDQVYVVDEDQRLAFRSVEVGLLQAELVSIRAGLQAGDQVVVSDLMPAIEGMLLAPYADDEAQRRLEELAEAQPH